MIIATIVVLADALMSFFRSAGNDARFNPWTTDITNEKNRGGLGAVIAVQPVIATILGSVVSGIIIKALDYFAFFIIMGIMISVVALLNLLLVKESPTLKPNIDEKGFWHQFGSAFNFKMFKENILLLWVFVIFAVFFISFNIYFPQIMNYYIYTLNYSVDTAGIILGAGLVLAIPLTIIAGKFINKGKFTEILTVAVILNIIGLLIITIKGTVTLIIGTFFVGGGYMMVYQTLMVWVKNLYPEDKRAQLEGVRLLFYVCIPMVIGPAIATPIINNWGKPMVNDYGEKGFSATNILFYISAIFAVLTFIPIYISKKFINVQNALKTENNV
jgi:MFS family permease